MKFCSKCGKEIMDEAAICPHCGCAVADSPAKESSGLANCALGMAFLMPIVGLILGIIGACKYKDTSLRNKSSGAIILSILMWIVYIIIIMNI